MTAIGENLPPQFAQDYLDALTHPLSVAGKSKTGIGQPESGRQTPDTVIFFINATRKIF